MASKRRHPSIWMVLTPAPRGLGSGEMTVPAIGLGSAPGPASGTVDLLLAGLRPPLVVGGPIPVAVDLFGPDDGRVILENHVPVPDADFPGKEHLVELQAPVSLL